MIVKPIAPFVLAVLVLCMSSVDLSAKEGTTPEVRSVDNLIATVELRESGDDDAPEIRLFTWIDGNGSYLTVKPGPRHEQLRARSGETVAVSGRVFGAEISVKKVQRVLTGVIRSPLVREGEDPEDPEDPEDEQQAPRPAAFLETTETSYAIADGPETKRLLRLCLDSEAEIIGSVRSDEDHDWVDVSTFYALLQGSIQLVEIESEPDEAEDSIIESKLFFVTDTDEEFHIADTRLGKSLLTDFVDVPLVVSGVLTDSEEDFWTIEPIRFCRLYVGKLLVSKEEDGATKAIIMKAVVDAGRRSNLRIDLSTPLGQTVALGGRNRIAVTGERFEHEGEPWLRVRTVRR